MSRLWRPGGAYRTRSGPLERTREPSIPRSPDDPAYGQIGDIRRREPKDMTLPELQAALDGLPGDSGLDGSRGSRGRRGTAGAAGATGATGAAGAAGGAAWVYHEAGLYVPTWPGIGTHALNSNMAAFSAPAGTAHQAYGCRFWSAAGGVVTNVIASVDNINGGGGGGALAKIQYAIYNADCTSLLRSTGMVLLSSLTGSGADLEQTVTIPLTATYTLAANTRYCLVVYDNASVGATFAQLMATTGASGYLDGITREQSGGTLTAADIVKWSPTFISDAGVGGHGASLPADLAAATVNGYSSNLTPAVVLE